MCIITQSSHNFNAFLQIVGYCKYNNNNELEKMTIFVFLA